MRSKNKNGGRSMKKLIVITILVLLISISFSAIARHLKNAEPSFRSTESLLL